MTEPMSEYFDGRLERYKVRVNQGHDLQPEEGAWLTAEVTRLREQVGEAESEVWELKGFLKHSGYRRCDSPACNCGSYHGGHALERLNEIYDVLGGCDSTTPVPAIKSLNKELTAAKEEIEQFREDYHHACKLVAKMHAAAIGEIAGPKRGLVEDVEHLAKQAQAANAVCEYFDQHPNHVLSPGVEQLLKVWRKTQ